MFEFLEIAATAVTVDLFGLDLKSALGSAVQFFLYDTVKILILLTVIVYAVSFLRGFFSPERTRKLLAGTKSRLVGHVAAAGLGIVTPFCSCSAVPLFIGFVEAGIPLGVTFSYLVSAPMINEVALGLLYAMFGWKIALLYVGSGLAIAIVSGILIGRARMEKHVADYVWKMKVGAGGAETKPTFRERLIDAWSATRAILAKIWIWVLVGIGVGAAMHGWAPADALADIAGPGNPFAVPIAVSIGIPLYANAAGVIPLVEEMLRLGMQMGTALAFMMAVTALSLPEMILLRQVLKPKLLALFIAIVGLGIVGTGYLFNAIM